MKHRSGSAVITAEGLPDCNTVKPETLTTIIFSVLPNSHLLAAINISVFNLQ